MGKAGSYAVQGKGGYMVKRLKGSYTNVVGLPICEIAEAAAVIRCSFVNTIEDGIQKVKEKISRACAKAGRSEKDVRLVAVTKRVDTERIHTAFSCGIKDFGENYIQEARRKIEAFGEGPCWHMIGHVQTNKVKYVPGSFCVCSFS